MVEDTLQAISVRIQAELKTVAQLRSSEPADSITHDPLFASLARALEDLEKRVRTFSTAVSSERAALLEGETVFEKLQEQRKRLDHILANLPKHRPRRQGAGGDRQGKRDALTEHRSNQEKVEGRERSGKRMEEDEARAEECQRGPVEISTTKPSAPAQARPRKAAPVKRKVTIEPLTVAEYEGLAKYQVGRLSRDRINDILADLSQLVADKHRVLRIPPGKMSKHQRDLFWEHKQLATPETAGKAFVTEHDVKEKDRFSDCGFRLDPAGRLTVGIARHLGRIKEVRGGGHTRLVVL
ncbi:Spindle and kinetochore-associated protein 1 [Thoreauomyces humboldtii]|nr:Spindle and kinetochore-associated protein 1 [Thoreauomyces humboldtii]